jgi:hypothetical protein
MAQAYTRRLGTGVTSGPTWLELYRAPATGTTVIRDVTVVNPTTASVAEGAIRMRPLTKAGEVWIWYSKPFGVGSTHFELRQVLAPGEALEVYTAVGGVHVAISGYVFAT